MTHAIRCGPSTPEVAALRERISPVSVKDRRGVVRMTTTRHHNAGTQVVNAANSERSKPGESTC